ncbi:MAG TPA: NAD(P)-dependent oxidoreductase [Burkholderiales bacterium]|nr:NAD(P)-dependent oxidoreductase [Burkholderiales bacterium]
MSQAFTETHPLHVHIENARSLMPVFQVREDQYRQGLERHPDVARRIRTTFGWDQDNWKQNARTAHAIITYRFPKETLAADAPNLQLLQILGAGVDYLLPLDWVPRGVKMLTNSGAHVPKAAQSGLMLLFMLNARMPELVWSHRAKKWNRVFTDTLAGKTVLIVGVGAIGAGIAAHAKQFGMRVLGIRKSGKPQPNVDEMHTPDALHALLPRADFVLLNLAFTPETKFIIGREELALMKKGAALGNMSRGGLVDPAALDAALRSGHLSGAAIDVTFPEPPPPDWPYWDTPNLMITPHVLSDDIEAYVPRTLDLFFDNLRRHFAGEPLTNLVDLERQY